MIEEAIVASRVYQGATWDFRSYVGLAFLKDDQIVTGLLDYGNQKIALKVSYYACDEYRITAFHNFAGLYLDRMAKVQVPRFEIFRFHRDVIKHNHTDDHETYGELLVTRDYEKGKLFLSIERFGGQPPLADTEKLVAEILADRLEELYLPLPFQLAPEPLLYKPGVQALPHPGMAFEDDEADVEIAQDDRQFLPKTKRTYVQ